MSDINQIKKYLNSIAKIEDKSLDSFCENRRVKSISKGKVLIRENEVADKLYFLHKGIFRYYLISTDGKDITKGFAIDTHNPVCMAYSSFMTNQPSRIFIDALTDTEISVWDRSYVYPLISADPHWFQLSQRLATGLFIQKEKKEISLLKDASKKRFEDFKNDFPDLLKRVPQHYIASYLNITPETLSRIKK